MIRKHLLLIPAVLVLIVMSVLTIMFINMRQQVREAKQEAIEAREMALESEQYEVQLMNITKYAPLSPDAIEGWDFSGDPSLTASEEELVPGETVAAGPNIPFGAKIYIEGFGWRTVNDRGRLIGPNDIDLAVETKKEAIEFGKQKRLVIIKTP